MKYKRPSLTAAALLLVLAWFGPWLLDSTRSFGQAPSTQPATGPTSASAPQTAESTQNADALLIAAQAALANHTSVTAKIRQQVDLFGQRLIGDGRYLQSGAGNNVLARMELKMQVAGEVTSLLQVVDGRYLWTEEQAEGGRHINRVDLGPLLLEWRKSDEQLTQLPGGRLPIGGLAEFLYGASANFQFARAGDVVLSGVPCYTLIGTWRKECLAALLPKQAKEIRAGKTPDFAELPDYVPHDLVLLLGQDDLFPYVADFRRYSRRESKASDKPAPVEARSMLRVQLHEVSIGAPIDLREFVYKPGQTNFADLTRQYVKLLKTRQERLP